ncbi:MAG: hypothetical protein MAGBODY4_00350 [Candidatus Marinimicrobia bacterium]|nr:hypothetical protein [Candidatus Neomarinimicrobiota bacterium]
MAHTAAHHTLNTEYLPNLHQTFRGGTSCQLKVLFLKDRLHHAALHHLKFAGEEQLRPQPVGKRIRLGDGHVIGIKVHYSDIDLSHDVSSNQRQQQQYTHS